VTYADGTTLNLFDEFDVSQEATIDWDLDNATPTSGVLRTKCQTTIRQVGNLLDGLEFKYLHAFCGDAFFDALIAHKEVVASYTATDEARELRRSYVENGASFGHFWFGDIMWENYRGTVAGNPMVATDSVHIFPVGVPGLFRSVRAPADYEETVNTMGKRLYLKQIPMPNGKGRELESQQNALHYCTRPKVLLQGTRS
jgi:Phage major capsid protein E